MTNKIEDAFKVCTCCARCFTREEWFRLPPYGTSVEELDDGIREVLDVRNCPEPCVSTLIVTIARSPTTLIRTLWDRVRPDGAVPYDDAVRAALLGAIEEHGALVDALAELEDRYNQLRRENVVLRAERRGGSGTSSGDVASQKVVAATKRAT